MGYRDRYSILLLLIVFSSYALSSKSTHQRYARHIINENEVPVNVEWLTDEQLSELGTLDNAAQVEKICQFYELLFRPEERKAAANKIITQCYDWLPEVTSETEREELKQLRDDNHTACQEQITVYILRLSELRQTQLLKYWSFCEHVWNDTLKHRESSLQDEEKTTLTVETPKETPQHPIEEPTDKTTNTSAQHSKRHIKHYNQDNVNRQRRSHHHHHHYMHDLDKCFKAHLNWLTDSQKLQIKSLKKEGKTRAQLQEKIMEFYEETSGDAKENAKTMLKAACRDYLASVIGVKKLEKIKFIKEKGALSSDIAEQVEQFVSEITNETIRNEAKQFILHCKKIYINNSPTTRLRRSHHDHHNHQTLEDYLTTHLSWLTDAQKDELRAMKAEGKERAEIQKKVEEYYSTTQGEVRVKATEQLKSGCSELFVAVFGQEKYNEVKKLKESGSPIDKIVAKVDEFIAGLTDEDKKKKINDDGSYCRKLFASKPDAKRKRRSHHDHHIHQTLEDYLTTHLSWLTDAQKDELRAMKAEGKERAEIQKKVEEYYSATQGEVRVKATEQLKSGCIELFVAVFGQEKYNEVKKLKESGSPIDKIVAKVDEFIAGLTDKDKKKKINDDGSYCRKLFDTKPDAKRKRRSHHDHHNHQTLEDYLTTHLSWLTDAQKDELRAMKAEGKERAEIQKKVEEYYSTTQGEVRVKATEQLKSGCSELFVAVFGQEKYNEVKKLKESGSPIDKIVAKVDEFIAGLTDKDKKKKINDDGSYCRKLFDTKPDAKRKRRSHHDHHNHQTLEDYLTTHLSWLTDAQKDELRAMKAEGKERAEIQKKVEEYYSATQGEVRVKATEQLKSGCIELFVAVFGQEKYSEVKKLKESGSPIDKIVAKMNEFIAGLTDEDKKKKINDDGSYCRKLFDTKPDAKRKKRSHHDHHNHQTLEDYLTTHLSWLTDAQKDELRAMKAEGKERAEIQKKVEEYYSATQGEVRVKATEQLKSGCIELFVAVFGQEKYSEVKKLKESGSPIDKIVAKMNEFIAGLTDEDKKKKINDDGSYCRKLFDLKPDAKRKRRHYDHHKHHKNIGYNDHNTHKHHEHYERHTLEDYLSMHLNWLTDSQKDNLRTIKNNGANRKDLLARLQEFYDAADSEIKDNAAIKLKDACNGLLVWSIGKTKFDEIRKLKLNDDETPKKVDSLIEQFAEEITDEVKKEKLLSYKSYCTKFFVSTNENRVKRNHHEDLSNYLIWLTDEQKDHIRFLKENEDNELKFHKKINEYYAGTTGEMRHKATTLLKNRCKDIFVSVFGKKEIEKLSELKSNGFPIKDLANKVKELIDDLTDEGKLAKIRKYGSYCQKLYEIEEYEKKESFLERTARKYVNPDNVYLYN